MIETLKSNKKTTGFGVLLIISEILRNNPAIISFLPDNVEGYILGMASVTFAVLTAIYARDRDSAAEISAKVMAKEIDRAELKQEITQETAALVETAKDLVEAKTPVIQVLPVTLPPKAVVIEETPKI